MKKAVIKSGARQYIVSEGQEISVNFLNEDKSVIFEPLMIIDGENTEVGTPTIDKVKVHAEIVNAEVKGDKVTSIRFKAKKRVKKVRGHRQTLTVLKITKIA